MTYGAKIIRLKPLKPEPPMRPSPEQLYREACWRLLHACFAGARVNHIHDAAAAMFDAWTKWKHPFKGETQ